MFVDELLDDLNPPQREAVLHENGPLLVLAGAGSGKTRVITRRIAHLVQVRHVEAWRILAVTFTNKAAREMRERLQVLLGPAGQGLTVSTFHSTASMLLRREAEAAGLSRNFVIYDDGDQLQLVKRALREAGVDVASVTPREILSRIDAEKNAGRLPDEMKLAPGDVKAELAQRIYRKYQALLKAANAVDFGDLLLLLVHLLRTNADVRAHYQRRFRHVLVDEFQDTNPVQYELLQLLAPPKTTPNLVVVGDDDQSIYRWRGAEVDNILGFPTLYEGCRVVKLEQNYRSDQAILEAAHAVIARNKHRMPKKLWTSRPAGEPLSLIAAGDEKGEAQEVAASCRRLRAEGICDWAQMAVFYRTNAQSRVLEEAFRLAQVPYVLVSGRSFYDRAEVRDAASYLRLMVNPHSDADFERVVNEPARGIGETTLERVRSFAQEAGVSLFAAVADPSRVGALNSGAIKRLTGFRQLVDRLVDYASKSPSATEATRFMLSETGLVAHHQSQGTDEALTRAENLRELMSATQEFDKQRAVLGAPTPPPTEPAPPREILVEPAPPLEEEEAAPASDQGDLFAGFTPPREKKPAVHVPVVEPEPVAPPPPEVAPIDREGTSLAVEAPPLQSFLEQVSLVGEADGETGAGQGRVSLMTLHAAKGLEFDAVFLTGMEEEIFPHRRATAPEASEEEMNEERRLCYVGFTRARRRLTCTLAQCRTLFGELRFNPPSRFLSEVPQALFGFVEIPTASQRDHLPPGYRRRGGDDDGPRVDRHYAQVNEFDQRQEDDVRGMKVSHQQFGRGVVVDVSGQGQTAKLTVKFETVGVKTVVARFLTPG